MKVNRIFSIVLVILLIFLFFWALQCHKQAEIEYYENEKENKKNSIINSLTNMTPIKQEHIDAAANLAAGILGKNAEDIKNAFNNAANPLEYFSKLISK